VHERLDRITTRAKGDTAAKFNNEFTLLNHELLFLAFRRLKRDKAPGVDGVTVDDYAANLQGLENRLHAGSYRPQPSLRREIPKGDGGHRRAALVGDRWPLS
jgi:retron-type reverse transcriptase